MKQNQSTQSMYTCSLSLSFDITSLLTSYISFKRKVFEMIDDQINDMMVEVVVVLVVGGLGGPVCQTNKIKMSDLCNLSLRH